MTVLGVLLAVATIAIAGVILAVLWVWYARRLFARDFKEG